MVITLSACDYSNCEQSLCKSLYLLQTTGVQEYTENGLYSTVGGIGKQKDISADVAYRIIADHSRMFTVCIADGLACLQELA